MINTSREAVLEIAEKLESICIPIRLSGDYVVMQQSEIIIDAAATLRKLLKDRKDFTKLAFVDGCRAGLDAAFLVADESDDIYSARNRISNLNPNQILEDRRK